MSERLLIQQRNVKGHGKWTTRWEFTKPAQGWAYYRGLNAHDGWAKRLVCVLPDGTRELLHREQG